MDISNIKAAATNTTTGLKIGADDAPVKLVEFINVRCPYCKQWFEESKELLDQYIAEGRLQRIIKPFNKEKESLQRGNVMHRYLDTNLPEKGYAALMQMFITQKDWQDLSLEEVARFAEDRLQLAPQANEALLTDVVTETNNANIQFVPTLIINDHIFDEAIEPEMLIQYIEE